MVISRVPLLWVPDTYSIMKHFGVEWKLSDILDVKDLYVFVNYISARNKLHQHIVIHTEGIFSCF